MKRILSILLSVILFFTLSFIIYLFTFKLLFKTNYFDRIIKENNVSEYINLSLGQKSKFVNNINTSYQDLKKLGLSEKEITNHSALCKEYRYLFNNLTWGVILECC